MVLTVRQGGESGAAATVWARIVLSRRENAMRHLKCVEVGYIGADAFVARERGISAAPMTTSLVTFLFGNKKVTLSYLGIVIVSTISSSVSRLSETAGIPEDWILARDWLRLFKNDPTLTR